jgi:transcriptional regulator with XRE-family HTH domain
MADKNHLTETGSIYLKRKIRSQYDTYAKFAQDCDMSSPNLSRILNGQQSLSRRNRDKFSKILNIPPEEFCEKYTTDGTILETFEQDLQNIPLDDMAHNIVDKGWVNLYRSHTQAIEILYQSNDKAIKLEILNDLELILTKYDL